MENESGVEGSPTKSSGGSESRFHVRLHVVSIFVGTILGLLVALYVDHRNDIRHRRILIPVLIEGADRQGGQFALGVSRAMDFAHRYRLDQVGEHRIDPWLIDERKDGVEIANMIKAENPPIVVGPLRSTPALDLVKRIAKARNPSIADADGGAQSTSPALSKREDGLGIPVILGIPTNPTITQQSDLVWRLSPTDDVQGRFVARAFQAAAHTGENAVIIKDLRKTPQGNPDYVNGLDAAIVHSVDDLHLVGYPALGEARITPERGFNEVQEYLENNKPTTIIFLGMPDAAAEVLDKAKAIKDLKAATWIFTDSCITMPQQFIPLVKEIRKRGDELFITFQAPPATKSPGFQLYMFYTASTGGNVLFALDRDKDSVAPSSEAGKSLGNDQKDVVPIKKPCNRALAAPTYEIFGFDSYLTALILLRDAASSPHNAFIHWTKTLVRSDMAVLRAGVIEKMASGKISDPLLIGDPYKFSTNGDSNNKDFYLYEFIGDCTEYLSLDELALRHGRKLPPITVQ